MSLSGGPSPAEQHLGDRLAALVDGELGHDARERVLAHLATCGKCKAEADAQRRLKNVFAQSAPPGPSEGLLARLQGLPGGDPGGPGSRLGDGGLGRGGFGRGDFARGGGSFGYVPGNDHGRRADRAPAGLAAPPRQRGFRVHEAERPAPQRRRFAFAAAGAVSLAAFALGGALPLEAAVDMPGGRPDGGGTAVTPLSATPVAGSGSLTRTGEFLTTDDFRTGTGARGGAPTVAPAPSAMSLYAPGAVFPHHPSPVPDPGGRFGLSPLIAATGPASPYHHPPMAAGTGNAPARAFPPLPPLEPKRHLIGSAAPAGPVAPGATPDRH